MKEHKDLYSKLVRLYTDYDLKNVSSILYHVRKTTEGEEELLEVNYGDEGRRINLDAIYTDWKMVGSVASKALSNSKRKKLHKLVDTKYRKASKWLEKHGEKPKTDR